MWIPILNKDPKPKGRNQAGNKEINLNIQSLKIHNLLLCSLGKTNVDFELLVRTNRQREREREYWSMVTSSQSDHV